MIKRLREFWFKIFPIDREKAIKIAAKELLIHGIRTFNASDAMPANMHIYMPKKMNEPCWYVTVPWILRYIASLATFLKNSRGSPVRKFGFSGAILSPLCF